MKELAPAPICPKCKKAMDSVMMEAIIALPAPTFYLSKWSCTACSGEPKKKTDAKK